MTSGTTPEELARRRKPEPLPVPGQEPKERICLVCDQPFTSTGLRKCPTCTRSTRRTSIRMDKGASRSTAGRSVRGGDQG